MAIIVKFEEKTSKWISDRSFDLFLFFYNTQNCFVKNVYSQAVTNGMGNETTQLLLSTGTKLSLTLSNIDCKLGEIYFSSISIYPNLQNFCHFYIW